MKKSSCYKWMMTMCVALMASVGVFAQSYHSKPTAIQNLADESKYITTTLPSFSEQNHDQFLRLSEKQRIIKKMLHSLKTGATVEQAVDTHISAETKGQFTTAIKRIPLPDGQRDGRAWIRGEILRLISY